MRTKNIGVVTIGYNHYAFEDTAVALQLMAMLSSAVQVDIQDWSLREETPKTHFMVESPSMPELKFTPEHLFNTEETVKEAKERFAREKADRADMDQQFKDAPLAISGVIITHSDDEPISF